MRRLFGTRRRRQPRRRKVFPGGSGANGVVTGPATVAATSGADKASGAKADAVVTAVVKTNASLPRRGKTDTAHAQKALIFTVVSKGPSIPPTPPRRRHPIVLAAAAFVGAGIGVGVYWLSVHKDLATAQLAATLRR